MSKIDHIPTHFDAQAARERYYGQWEEQGFFHGDPSRPGKSYSLVIPPPNVTGSLHMGHALNNTLQDILVRYHRMDGDNVVWIPGTDHASIAVHWLIEKELEKEGTSRDALGREKFLERAWQFKERAGTNIINQLRQLGVACDWKRERFTMDEGLSRAVREAFVRLYEDGLIYRSETLVNWDPVTQTTLSDLEVVHEEGIKGELWSFAYPLTDGGSDAAGSGSGSGSGSGDSGVEGAGGAAEIVVATTRPETMLGDTAIAVHPDDPRYRHLIGKKVRHPLVDREIPIVADGILVDPEFGTGAVKVTPAHDFNDFEVGKRHGLAMINILTKDGRINDEGGEFEGMTVPAAREAVKAKIESLGLDRGTDPHTMNIGRSERSGAVVEPMLSTQWFVRAKPLAAPALAAVENGFTRFVPAQWANTYYSWLRDIRDWCVSRQLWWGHQIPAWYCDDCGHVNVQREDATVCQSCEGTRLTQDADVLDTWFSSSLWPFSTMGWPEKTPALQRWYPTATLVTGFDIIFFWVARMMMMGQYFMGRVPFADVYIHALIRDPAGEKMSKTKGNVVDPLDMIEKYGCDAFRFTLAAFAAQGRDVRWDESRAAGYHKFGNKVWQAFRFMMANVPADGRAEGGAEDVWDRWILHRLSVAVERYREALDTYRFNDAAGTLYAFIWDEFCDWYLELAKVTLYADDAPPARKGAVERTLVDVFDAVIRLLHPIMPFMSEELWQNLPGTEGSVMQARFPRVEELARDEDVAREAGFIKEAITAIRRVRAEYGVSPKQPLQVLVRADTTQSAWLDRHARVVQTLARATCKHHDGAAPAKVATEVVSGADIYVLLEGIIDFDAEISRLRREIEKVAKDIDKLNSQLCNDKFVARAPAAVVAEKRELLSTAEDKKARLDSALARLQGSPVL